MRGLTQAIALRLLLASLAVLWPALCCCSFPCLRAPSDPSHSSSLDSTTVRSRSTVPPGANRKGCCGGSSESPADGRRDSCECPELTTLLPLEAPPLAAPEEPGFLLLISRPDEPRPPRSTDRIVWQAEHPPPPTPLRAIVLRI